MLGGRLENTGEKRRGMEKCHDAMIERCIAINSHWPVSSVAGATKSAEQVNTSGRLSSADQSFQTTLICNILSKALLISAENSPPSETRGPRNESERYSSRNIVKG